MVTRRPRLVKSHRNSPHPHAPWLPVSLFRAKNAVNLIGSNETQGIYSNYNTIINNILIIK